MSNYVCNSKAQIKPEAFHRIVGGSQVDLYTLKNSNGLEAKITNYGGIVVSLLVPDKNGKLTDVVLGYDDLCDYLAYTPYFGCIVGRYGNRIAPGSTNPNITSSFEYPNTKLSLLSINVTATLSPSASERHVANSNPPNPAPKIKTRTCFSLRTGPRH